MKQNLRNHFHLRIWPCIGLLSSQFGLHIHEHETGIEGHDFLKIRHFFQFNIDISAIHKTMDSNRIMVTEHSWYHKGHIQTKMSM